MAMVFKARSIAVVFNETKNSNFILPSKWTFEELWPCNCYAIQTNSRKIYQQVSQPASAGNGAGLNELQAHHCITPEQRIWLLWSVSVIPANKLLLKELNYPNALILLKCLEFYRKR